MWSSVVLPLTEKHPAVNCFYYFIFQCCWVKVMWVKSESKVIGCSGKMWRPPCWPRQTILNHYPIMFQGPMFSSNREMYVVVDMDYGLQLQLRVVVCTLLWGYFHAQPLLCWSEAQVPQQALCAWKRGEERIITNRPATWLFHGALLLFL